jgi:hypothetical protein|tara:strand:+ start:78 stop:443 length:366 start_codon:yes stop_codon:yes gene_type:complete
MEEEKDYLYVFTNGATHGFTLRCYDVSSGTPTVLFEEIMNGYITWTNNFYVGINGTCVGPRRAVHRDRQALLLPAVLRVQPYAVARLEAHDGSSDGSSTALLLLCFFGNGVVLGGVERETY